MPAPLDFKKLFKDTEKYPDTMEIQMGDQKMNLGVLRAWNTEHEGELVQELESRRKALQADSHKVDQARQEVANMYLDLEEQRRKLAASPEPKSGKEADPLAEYEQDPIAGGLAKLVREQNQNYMAELKAIREENKKLIASQEKMGLAYMGDRARQDYASLAKEPDFDLKDSSLDINNLWKTALDNGYKDHAGIPDIKKAFKTLTEEKRTARLIKEAEERGRAAAADEARMSAMMPRPSNGRPVGEQAPAYKDIDGALNAALNDKNIWVGNA